MNPNGIDPRLLVYVHRAFEDVFKIQLSSSISVESKAGVHATPFTTVVMAVLRLDSSDHEGSFGLFFPAQTVIDMYNRLVGEEMTAINSENVDSTAEILNIAFASARTKINNDLRCDFKPALPSIVQGNTLSISFPAEATVFTFNYKSDVGLFQAQIGLKKRKLQSWAS